MIFNWFNTAEAEIFAKALATSFIKNVPLAHAKDKKSLKKIFREADKMNREITIFKNQHKMNFFIKAKIANTFKWELKEAGYDNAFVDELSNILVLKL